MWFTRYMWIVRNAGCDTDRRVGKRVWLRPGKKYLFGRVKTEGGECCFALGYGYVDAWMLQGRANYGLGSSPCDCA